MSTCGSPWKCWDVRRDGDGVLLLDGRVPEPSPTPVTTIAWRMIHVAIGMSTRVSAVFGDGSVPDDADMFNARHLPHELPGTASAGVRLLEDSYRGWRDGIAGLTQRA